MHKLKYLTISIILVISLFLAAPSFGVSARPLAQTTSTSTPTMTSTSTSTPTTTSTATSTSTPTTTGTVTATGTPGPIVTPSFDPGGNRHPIGGLPQTGGGPIRNEDFPWSLVIVGVFSAIALVIRVRAYRRTHLPKQ